MAPPSKTIMDYDIERKCREHDPVGYAIKEHERKCHNGLFDIFKTNNSYHKTLPPKLKMAK